MAEIIVHLRVVTPRWLSVASWISIRALAAYAAITQRAPSDEQVNRLARWYAAHLRIKAETSPIRG